MTNSKVQYPRCHSKDLYKYGKDPAEVLIPLHLHQSITIFIFFYNYIRPHSGLNDLTPAQVAGIKYTNQQRNNWLLTA